jgi:hypothetical protein
VSTVTRLQIADVLGDAFGPTGADKADLLATAARAGAHPAVLEELHKIPDRRYRTMRALWDHLPEVPVE